MNEIGDIRIALSDLTENAILAGAPAGREMLAKLLMFVSRRFEAPQRVYLDFESVSLATVSFLREGPFAFRSIVRREFPLLYPIMANTNDLVRDEIVELLDLRKEAAIICDLDGANDASNFEVVGHLDPKQKMTLDLVCQLKEVGAPELMRDYGIGEGTTQTSAWNNRLANLCTTGLIVEFSQGRAKRYRPVMGD